VIFPILLGENVTVHVPESVAHSPEAGVNVPDPAGEAVKVTVPPVGVISTPVEESVTVAVHVVLAVTWKLEEVHDTLMEEVRLVAVNGEIPTLDK
jgi:hypothetical protein